MFPNTDRNMNIRASIGSVEIRPLLTAEETPLPAVLEISTTKSQLTREPKSASPIYRYNR